MKVLVSLNIHVLVHCIQFFQFSVYPGENFVFFIKTLDELGHPMFSAIHAIQGNDVSDFTADVSMHYIYSSKVYMFLF